MSQSICCPHATAMLINSKCILLQLVCSSRKKHLSSGLERKVFLHRTMLSLNSTGTLSPACRATLYPGRQFQRHHCVVIWSCLGDFQFLTSGEHGLKKSSVETSYNWFCSHGDKKTKTIQVDSAFLWPTLHEKCVLLVVTSLIFGLCDAGWRMCSSRLEGSFHKHLLVFTCIPGGYCDITLFGSLRPDF